jgi:hypothetical protein
MYGLTRGSLTLIGAAAAGLLIWISTQISTSSTGGYWAAVGLIAGAGLAMAVSQLLGGWTKWGWPRVSGSVFLLGFLPVLVAAGWVLLAAQPESNWFQRHISSWSGSIGIGGLVGDLVQVVTVLAFGLGLVFGLIFDTTGPRTEPVFKHREDAAPDTAAPTAGPADEQDAERRRAAAEAGATTATPRTAPTEERPTEEKRSPAGR